ncbi:hypothetical protein NX059_002969 [Plenodomus lindquistii]|nr:hypothetical protein NX059_002969 [Plenodomus lindquistii]
MAMYNEAALADPLVPFNYTTVYPTPTPTGVKLFPTYAPFIPPSAGLSASSTATSTSTGIPSLTPAPPNPSDHHDKFDIKSLTPFFVALSCIALLLVVLFAYAVWSKCCIGGRFGFGFGCRECKELKEEVEQWKTGQKVRITPGMVRARESANTIRAGSSSTTTRGGSDTDKGDDDTVGEAVPVAYPSYYADDQANTHHVSPTVVNRAYPYYHSDGNPNNDNPDYTISRALSTTFQDVDVEAGAPKSAYQQERDAAHEAALAAFAADSPPASPRPKSNFWTYLKARYGPSKGVSRPVSDIELGLNPTAAPFPRTSHYTASIYSRSTGEWPNARASRAFTEHSAADIPATPAPRNCRTSEDAQKTYSAYLTEDYAPRDRERKILLAEGGLTSRAYKEAEQQVARKSIKSADLQTNLDIVNEIDRRVNRARHPSQYSPSIEELPSPRQFADY